MKHERRTAHTLTRLRELEALQPGTVVMANSAPHPRYFRRVPGGWAASDAFGRTALQRILARELDGWPRVLDSSDIRRPVAVVARPDDLPLEVRAHELPDELAEDRDLEDVLRLPAMGWAA